MTNEEGNSLGALSASLDRFAEDISKSSRDYLDIAGMAAGQLLGSVARSSRKIGPLEEDAEYWLWLWRIEARAERLAARAARLG